MRTRLLLLGCAFALLCTPTMAQRRTAQMEVEVKIGEDVSGTCSYSYKVVNGERVLDGPVTVNGGVGKVGPIDYKYWYTLTMNETYSVKANHTNGVVNGPVTMNYSMSASATNGERASRSATYKGNYKMGIPHGNFKYTRAGDFIGFYHIDVNYTNGIFTGPFRYKCEGWHNNDVTGSFTNDGKLNGTWTITYSERLGAPESGTDVYVFKNGVMVGGDFMSSDPTIKSYATKYANGQITNAQLFEKGFLVKEERFLCRHKGYHVNGVQNPDLYYDIATYIHNEDCGVCFDDLGYFEYQQDGAKVNYVSIVRAPILTSNGVATLMTQITEDGRAQGAQWDEFVGANYFVSRDLEYTGESVVDFKDFRSDYYYRYYVAERDIPNISKFLYVHNLPLAKKQVGELISERSVISINGNIEGVLQSCTFLEYDLQYGFKTSIDVKIGDSEEYQTYEGYCLKDPKKGVVFTDFKRVKSKYDQIAELRKSTSEEKANLEKWLNERKETIDKYPRLQKEVARFWSHTNGINTETQHKNLPATIEALNRVSGLFKDFPAYFEKYTEIAKLDAEITPKNILGYAQTLDNSAARWSESYSLEEMDKVIAWQKRAPAYAEVLTVVNSNNKALAEKQRGAEKAYRLYRAYLSKSGLEYTMVADTAKLNKIIEVQKKSFGFFDKFAIVNNLNSQIKAKSSKATTTYNEYKSRFSSWNIVWTPDVDETKLDRVIELQKRALAYIEKMGSINDCSEKIKDGVGVATDAYKAYSDYFSSLNLAWNESADASNLDKVIKMQVDTYQFIVKYNNIQSVHSVLIATKKAPKTIAGIYATYFASCDLSWSADVDNAKMDEVINIQRQCAKIFSHEDCKKFDKRVKKEMITDIKTICERFAK